MMKKVKKKIGKILRNIENAIITNETKITI